MNGLKLTLRMRQVADLVPEGSRVADIGCDHAYVSIYLCRERGCVRVIAMDVRQGPLEHARQNIHRAGLEERITLRLSDGLDMLSPGEVDTIVMAGMGGALIMELLSRKKELLKDISVLVLQPQSELAALRKYVWTLGFEIVGEAMVWDREKPYFIMRCQQMRQKNEAVGRNADGKDEAAGRSRHGKDGTAGRSGDGKDETAGGRVWTETELQYGRFLLHRQDPGLFRYLLRQEKQLLEIREKLAAQSGGRAKARLSEVTKQLEYNRDAQAYYGK